MADRYDDEHFKSKNGATIAGHAEKWANKNRRSTSTDAGQGSRASRHQGTGSQGKRNQAASTGIDTSKMDKESKLKYFNSLGLMPTLEPEKPVKATLKTFPDAIRSTFKGEDTYLKDISSALKALPREEYQDRITSALNAFNTVESDDVYDKYSAIMQAIQ